MLYKVSILNEADGNFYVKHCGLKKGQAVKLTDELIMRGLIVQFSPHIKDKQRGRRT